MHFHVAKDVPHGLVSKCSWLNTFQRCISIHASSYVQLEHSVAMNIRGHCYFLEVRCPVERAAWLMLHMLCHACVTTRLACAGLQDGAEDNNVMDHNLAINVASVSSTSGVQLIPSDSDATAFWITHPQYVYGACVGVHC